MAKHTAEVLDISNVDERAKYKELLEKEWGVMNITSNNEQILVTMVAPKKIKAIG